MTRRVLEKSSFKTLVFLFYSLVTLAQNQGSIPNSELSPSQLQEDFTLAREILETMHPALYDVVPKGNLTIELDSTNKLLNQAMSVLDFYKKIAPLVFQLGCGHTAIGLPKKEDSYIDHFFPFKLKFLRGKAFIIGADEGKEAVIGAEVLKINEVPVKTVVHKLFRYISTDGINESNKYMWLDSKFDRYYGLHIGQPATFNFSIKTKSGHDSLITVPALRKRLVSRGNLTDNISQKHSLPFYLNLENPKTAILTIDKFYVSENFDETIYTAFLDSCFRELKIKKVKNLVIDLRQNPGGYGTWGAWLYAYLADKPFSYYKEAIVKTDKSLPFLKYTDWKESEYQEYVKDIVKTPAGTYLWTAHSNLKVQYPRKNSFAGAVYVLIGRKSFSTTAEFCAIAHANKRAIFVGEETGGGYFSINGGDMMEATLPNSKIKLLIPMRKYVMAIKNYPHAGHGTIPDYLVQPTIQEFLDGADTEMKFVLGLINKKK